MFPEVVDHQEVVDMEADDVADVLGRLSVASDDERRQLLNNVRPLLERHESRLQLKVVVQFRPVQLQATVDIVRVNPWNVH